MKLYLTLDLPSQWTVVNGKGELVDQGICSQLEQIKVPRQVDEIIGIAPGQAVTTRSVIVPGRSRSNVEAALPYALEDSLGEDVERLHFTLLEWQAGKPAIVSIVAKNDMTSWLNDCRQANIYLDRIVPGYLVLPLHAENSITVSTLEDDSLYIRNGKLSGFAMDRDFYEYWMESEDLADVDISVTDAALAKSMAGTGLTRVSHWDIGNSLSGWLRLGGQKLAGDTPSLLHGEFVPPHRSRSYRPLKVAVFCSLVAGMVYFAAMVKESRELGSQKLQIKQEMVALFKQHFPSEPYLGRPRFQIQSLLQSQTGGSGDSEFQRLLHSMSRVTLQHQAEIEEVNYRNRAITVTCNVGSLTVLDNIRQSLQQLPGISAELLSSGARDNKVTGRFRVSGS